jgi:lysophospholipase L1-like esterase
MGRGSEQGWLTLALIRAGTLASGTAILAAVLATPVAAQPDQVDPAPPAETTQVERQSLTVEALGDSFFTGLGAGHYQRPDARRQSQAAGFLQALSRLEASNPGLDVTVQNHSSAGATVDNLYDTQMAGGLLGQNMPINPPQLEGVNPNADVAIMGFGGNDVGFVDAIKKTFSMDAPLRIMVDDLLAGQLDVNRPAGDYLADAARPRGQQETLIGELVRGIQEARRAMPNAKVVVTTYPEAVDPQSTSMMSVISSEELATFGELARTLNAAIRQAAALTGATVADNADAFDGHEVYTDDPYLHDLAPQWKKYDRDEAMHPNAAGQTHMADAIADAIAKVTGLNPATPHAGDEPYPTDGLTQVPRRSPRPTRSLPEQGLTPEQPVTPEKPLTPEKISWSPDTPADEGPADNPADDSDLTDGSGPADNPADGEDQGTNDPGIVIPPQDPEETPDDQSDTPGGTPNPPDDEDTPENPESGGTDSNSDQSSDTTTPPDNGGDSVNEDDGATGSPDNPENDGDSGADSADNSDNSDNGEDRGNTDSGSADTPENGGDRGDSGSGVSGPADNPGNGGDRGDSGSGVSGPADNPGNGGDRGDSGSGVSGPADNPENGGDRGDSGSGVSGPADNPENGGDRGDSGSGISGPADNPENGGDRDSTGSGISGPADNPENGGDRGDSDDSGSGVSGPADNPGNGGDRGSDGGSSGGSDSGSASSDSSGSDSSSDASGSDGASSGSDTDSSGDSDSGADSSGDSDSGAGSDSGTSGRGPADNPENGGDRDQDSYGGGYGDSDVGMV